MLDAVLAGARPGSLGAQLRRQPMHPNNPPATPTQDALDRFLIPDASDLAADLAVAAPGRGARGAALDAAVCRLLDDWSLLSFVALDRGEGEEDEGGRGVADVLAQACAQGGRRGARVCRRGGGGEGWRPRCRCCELLAAPAPAPTPCPPSLPSSPGGPRHPVGRRRGRARARGRGRRRRARPVGPAGRGGLTAAFPRPGPPWSPATAHPPVCNPFRVARPLPHGRPRAAPWNPCLTARTAGP